MKILYFITDLERREFLQYFCFQTEQKLLKVCTVATCVWFVSWTPYAVVFLLPMVGGRPLVNPHVDMIPGILCKLAAAINPIIYGLLWVSAPFYFFRNAAYLFRMPKFVRCARRLFGRRQSREFVDKNLRCLRRKKALSDTFIELGPLSLAEHNSTWY